MSSANWVCIRNIGIAKSFDVRVIQGKNVTVYCDTYVRGKRVESKPQCYDVRLTQGKPVRVYCDKYIKVGELRSPPLRGLRL